MPTSKNSSPAMVAVERLRRRNRSLQEKLNQEREERKKADASLTSRAITIRELNTENRSLRTQVNNLGDRVNDESGEARKLRITLKEMRSRLLALGRERVAMPMGVSDEEMRRWLAAVEERIETLESKLKATAATADRVPALETTIRTLAEMLPRGPVVKEWRFGIDWSRPTEPKPEGFPSK